MTGITAAQLFKLELIALLVAAALLLVVPATTARVLGLAPVDNGFWPRLVGALLLGLAIAALATDQGWLTVSTAKGPVATGIGLGAFVALNLTTAFVLTTLLLFGAAAPTKRGTILLWLLVAGMALLGFVEIAYVR